MVNKLVLNSGFPFASTLTALHQLFAYLVTSALIAAGLVPKVPHSIVTTTRAATTATAVTSWLRNLPRRRFFVATLYASGLVLMNQSLGLNSVSFYQLLKMSCIPVIALLQFFMYGTVLPRKTTIALTLILIGVSISTTAESSTYIKNPHHHPPSNSHHYYTTNNYESATTATSFLTLLSHTRPLLTSLAAVTTTSLSQILLTRSPDLQRLSSLQCIHALAGTSFFVCGVCAVAVDVGVSPADWARLVLGLTPGVGAVVPTAGVEFLVFGGEEEVSVARQQKQMIAAATAAAAGGSAGNDLHEFLGGVSSRAYLAEHILGKFINFFNKISITNSAEAATAAKSSLHSSFGTSTGSTTRSGITTATVASGLHPAFSNIFVWVLFSCVLGVVTNLFGFAVIKQTSPITYQVIGHFKTVSTMAIGVLLFGDVLGGISGAVGIFLAIVGMMIYSQK
ncbi:hypothetical protein HK100_005666 [Physocladia obscura]|uniref:GDP-mannose transporter n=1 Tax=Physocladia obscura TaxID=109957 RepID=A0AAD5T6F4_9FUNG|nr:hypothetical protein HK100_005666 [Physocladia obscura]